MQYWDLIIYENVMGKDFILPLHLTVSVSGLWDNMVGIKRLLKELKNFCSTVNRQWENIFIDDLLIQRRAQNEMNLKSKRYKLIYTSEESHLFPTAMLGTNLGLHMLVRS